MKIILGYELDTGSFPDALGGEEAREGIVVLGPLGFLGVLETQLGLSGKHVHQAVRIGQYHNRMMALDEGKQFYSNSFEADAWSTAKELLSWRDELVLAGWKGQGGEEVSPRIQVLSRLEKDTGVELASGLGDRLWSVLDELGGKRNLDIKYVQLIEPRESWPEWWQKVFHCLEQQGIELQFSAPESKEGKADLGLLKGALLRGSKTEKVIRGDGSLLYLTAETEGEAAEAAASWLAADTENNSDVLIIRGSGSGVLDKALHRLGLPKLGIDSRSRWRTALQVFSLALSNLWEPFDPYRLLEILSLPKLPIPKKAAIRFEKAIRTHPGIDGPMWRGAREKALSDFEQDLRKQGIDGSQLKGRTKHFDEELHFWLGENRHDPGAGVTKEIVANVCEKVGAWAAKRGGQDEDRLLLTAATLASRLTAAVEASGSTTISRPQLARIIDSVVAEGAENPDDYSEAAPWHQVRSPGQVWGSVRTVIWWNCVSSQVRATRLRWTKGEIDFLERNGVKLEDSASARIREALSWHRPALMAQKRLMLIAPRSINGEVVSPHPVWDEFRHLLQLDNSEGSAEKITFTASRLTEGEKVKLNGRMLKRNKVAIAPLPAPRGIWPIDKSGTWRREKESFTSMTKLIECPLAWFFAYVLKLYPGTLMSLPEGSHMLGTMSHALVQRLFTEWAAMSPTKAKARAEELYDLMVPEMAAPLLQPGLELERERYREAISRAIEKLVSLLQSARLKVSGSEETFEKEFLLPGKTFQGRIDLLLENSNGEKVIWDLKWSTRAKYKREELEGGKALQLAAYAWLLAEADGSFPPAGYFMLSQGELLSVSCEGIPDHCQFQEVDLKSVWESGVAAYRRRNKELEQGVVVAAALLPDEEEGQDEAGSDAVLELEPNCRWCDYVNLCGAERQPDGK